MAEIMPEIAVMWEPSHPQSTVFYQIPCGERRQAQMSIYPRIGRDIPIQIVDPEVVWLQISPMRSGGTPPVRLMTTVNTAKLLPNRQYFTDVVFNAYGTEIWRETVRISTAPVKPALPEPIAPPQSHLSALWDSLFK